ncbi:MULTISPECIES: MFS transporter [unclassified Streptomyces]|uniref:MFS transporter n=1 Tax=unclassified Streptomyces TaxID=2593676 RepID=UPI001BE5BED7|nr:MULTISPECIES: MFS transporter [unclassified Streptomyces]MBT2407209.1 MFS transporter [Streptomyces sp. ISL-21]MBT2612098.1 MFS transporter [Streptomyces sp. ISL-87]
MAVAPIPTPADTTTPSPWAAPDFRTLFAAATLNQLATNTGYIAVPLLALTTLDATPAQVGTLAALSTLAFLLIGLPAGAWVDRLRTRRVLITADLARAALFASLPLARLLDALTLAQLYAVVLVTGCATVFSDVGSQSVLPQLIGRDRLVRANAAVVTLMAAANIAGRGAGGFLVAALTAPFALACASVAYLASALRLTRIQPTPAPPAAAERTRLLTQIKEGLHHVLGHAELRALALASTLTNLGGSVINTMLPVLFVRELGLSPASLGLFWAAGGVGLLLGARLAEPLAARIGYGRAVVLNLTPAALLVPLLDHGPWLWLAGGGWMVAMMKVGSNNVLGVSLRQHLTPDPLLGRMNATFRFMLTGAIALGSAASGLLTELTTLHTTLWVGAAILASSWAPLALSPLRKRTGTGPAQREEAGGLR